MIYAIGDIHGELAKLHRLVQMIEADGIVDEDRIVFVGDYVDRGPDSAGVLEFLIRMQSFRPNTVFLRGNHDQAMMDAHGIFDKDRESGNCFEDVAWWFAYGGRETIESYAGFGPKYHRIPESHWQFLEQTELDYREGNYLFVHAGVVPPGVTWREKEDPRMWIREAFVSNQEDLGTIVVFGHSPQKSGQPLVMCNKIGIDTAAAFGGPLTAVALEPKLPYNPESLRFIQVR